MPRRLRVHNAAAVPSEPERALDARFLESLIGYNARRAALKIIDRFLERMSPFGLRPVDFSVLSLIRHNGGSTSREICASLGILPPNFVRLVASLDARGLIARKPHPTDGRAIGLHLTESGERLMDDAESVARELEIDVTAKLSPTERKTLITLLQKIYKSP